MSPNPHSAFDALGNPTRREILTLLEVGPRTVGELAGQLPVSRPAVSRHLRLLEDAQLIATEAAGRTTVVRLSEAGFEAARAWLDAFWDDALARFKLVAENTEES